MARLTKEIVNERIAPRGLELIGEFVKASEKTTFRCLDGHDWSATPSNIMSGKGCPHCAGNIKLTKAIVNERIASRGIRMINEYVTARKKVDFVCAKGHQWSTTPDAVMRGQGCKKCAGLEKLTKDEVNVRLAPRKIKIIAEYVNTQTKTKFQCHHGHEWETTPGSVMSGKGCPQCVDRSRNSLTADEINKRIAPRKIKMIGEYKNTKDKVKFVCDIGHEWLTPPSNVLSGCGCPKCAQCGTNDDAIYIWQAKGEQFNGKPVYKVGVTSAYLGDKRISQVINRSGGRFTAKIVTLTAVDTSARAIERQLHELGEHPGYTGFDGCTEFRAMSDAELKTALDIIHWHAVKQSA